jgi:glycerol-3-phosphate dehydrogenase
LRSVTPLWPAIEGAEQVAAYAGLRPAGRGVNYLIRRSAACGALVNVAAIRSTGLTASLGIAERVCALVEEAGVGLGPGQPLRPGAAPESATPWWRRTAEHRAA